jgi:dsDNA-specific endonuclease/ATPase MutS2
MANHEMLEVQLGRFRNELETAIANGTRRIVFIHGIGNGTLKQELRKELSTKYKKYYFQDASFKEYGYGATMVILKGN